MPERTFRARLAPARLSSSAMKALFTIILLFSMALPGSAWARVVESLPCALEMDCAVEKALLCACCNPEQCTCHQPADQTPAKPLPSVPPRPASAGDPLFVVLFPDYPLRDLASPVITRGAPALPEPVTMSCQTVPLYLRHCAMLW